MDVRFCTSSRPPSTSRNWSIGARAPARHGRRSDRLLPRQSALPVRPRPTPATSFGDRTRAARVPAEARARERRLRTAGPPAQPRRLLALHVRLLSPTASAASVVDVDYYKSMGEYAYGSLSRRDETIRLRRSSASCRASLSASWTCCRDVSERTGAGVERRHPAALREVAADRQRRATASGWSSAASSRTSRSATRFIQ